eukprot:g1426.t1
MYKSYAWCLDEYDQVQYMDNDLIPRRSMDHNFGGENELISVGNAAPANAGYFLAFPNCKTAKLIRESILVHGPALPPPRGSEGANDENVLSVRTKDGGMTWAQAVHIEPNPAVPVAYGVPVLAKSGRVYCIYNMNSDNITRLPNGKPLARHDELGHFKLKWTDDFGTSWSQQRVEIPYRLTSIDLNNSWHGGVREMWTVDKPIIVNGTVYMAFTKIGTYVQSPPEQVFLLASENLLTEPDPAAVVWKLLPEGDTGVTNPRNAQTGVCEEGHVVPMASAPAPAPAPASASASAAPVSAFWVGFRTADGYMGSAVSTDLGRSFGPSEYVEYCAVHGADPAEVGTEAGAGAAGRLKLKHPRGPFTPWLIDEARGVYLMLFYNNGQEWKGSYRNRNPYFITLGRVTASASASTSTNSSTSTNASKRASASASTICWSQPEIFLYAPDQDLYLEGAGGYPDVLVPPPAHTRSATGNGNGNGNSGTGTGTGTGTSTGTGTGSRAGTAGGGLDGDLDVPNVTVILTNKSAVLRVPVNQSLLRGLYTQLFAGTHTHTSVSMTNRSLQLELRSAGGGGHGINTSSRGAKFIS